MRSVVSGSIVNLSCGADGHRFTSTGCFSAAETKAAERTAAISRLAEIPYNKPYTLNRIELQKPSPVALLFSLLSCRTQRFSVSNAACLNPTSSVIWEGSHQHRGGRVSSRAP